MMTPDQLEVGKVYFTCGFLLRFRPVPMIRTLVFVGTNVIPEGSAEEDLYYFQAPEKYFHEELAFEAAEMGVEDYDYPDDSDFYVVNKSNIGELIFDLIGLMEFIQNLPNEHNAKNTLGGLG